MWGFTSIFQLSLFYLLFFYLIIIIFFGIELRLMYQAYLIPIKLKYDCLAPSKFGNDLENSYDLLFECY